MLVEAIPHQQFIEQTKGLQAIIRTGEFTPYVMSSWFQVYGDLIYKEVLT
jgi:hypothetical protein